MSETIVKEFNVDFSICATNDVVYPKTICEGLVAGINVKPMTMPIVHSVSAVKHGFCVNTNAIIGAIKSAELVADNQIKFTCDLTAALGDVNLDEYVFTPIGIGVIQTVDNLPTYVTYRPLAFTFAPKS